MEPDVSRYLEWQELIADYGGVGLDGSGFWGDNQPVVTPDGYRQWVAALVAEGDDHVPPAEGRVKCSYFWIVDDSGAWVGFLSLRRSLNDFLIERGGHIGYSIRPSRRREGHASVALRLALEVARTALGLEQVLVTCDDDNYGSRRTIEGNGGVLEDVREGVRRYWIAI